VVEKWNQIEYNYNERTYNTVHLQKKVFAATNYTVTHNQVYFDKINSKHQINPIKEPNHSSAPATRNPPAMTEPRLGHGQTQQ
jgi:hypothetical protein